MSNKGTLFLIPTVIAADTQDQVVTPQALIRLQNIRHFLVENVRTARRFLSSLHIYESIAALSFSVLNKDTAETELAALLSPVFNGHHLGVLSESGCPGIADPGAVAVAFAHKNGIKVVPLVGPSSVFLALMASGLNGQQFAFRGYLPIQMRDAAQVIREIEKESRIRQQTQIVIETPYRNNALMANLLKTLMPQTRLCIALDITGKNELIQTRPVSEWRKNVPDLPKEPAVFLFLA